MSEKPESNGPPPPLPEIPPRPPTPIEATTHTTPLPNGARLSTVLPATLPPVVSAMPLVPTASAPLPLPPPPPPPPIAPIVKAEMTIKSELVDTKTQPGQIHICRDFIRGSCIRGAKCRHLHEYDQWANKDNVFCHDFQNKGCNRPYCTFIHATISEQVAFNRKKQLPRNGETQNCQSSTVDMNIIMRPPPQSTTNHTVSHNSRAPTNFSQGATMDAVLPPSVNLTQPPPAVPKWNSFIRPNGQPTNLPPPHTDNFTRPPAQNKPPVNYFPPTNQPPPTVGLKDNGWLTPSQQPSIKNDTQTTDRNIGIKRTWPESGDNMNASQSLSPGHKTMRMDFMGSCSNCKLLESRWATANSTIFELLKIVGKFEKWQKDAEKQKSLLEHISSIIGSNQTHTPLGDNINNTLLGLELPAASLCTPHTQIQSGFDSQQMTMQPSLQLPQLLQIQRNHSSNDQQVRLNSTPTIMGNSQNWSDTNLNGQQQSMMSVSYGDNQVMLHTPPGRQLTPQQQQVLQLLDSSGFSISYK